MQENEASPINCLICFGRVQSQVKPISERTRGDGEGFLSVWSKKRNMTLQLLRYLQAIFFIRKTQKSYEKVPTLLFNGISDGLTLPESMNTPPTIRSL